MRRGVEASRRRGVEASYTLTEHPDAPNSVEASRLWRRGVEARRIGYSVEHASRRTRRRGQGSAVEARGMSRQKFGVMQIPAACVRASPEQLDTLPLPVQMRFLLFLERAQSPEQLTWGPISGIDLGAY